MDEPDAYLRIAGVKVFGKVLGAIYAAVLSASAAEGEHQVCKSAADIALHMVLSQWIDMAEEGEYLAVVFQKLYHRLV